MNTLRARVEGVGSDVAREVDLAAERVFGRAFERAGIGSLARPRVVGL